MGVAVALLRAGLVLGEHRLLDAAMERTLAQSPPARGESPDLFHGLAGRVLANLLMWDASGDAHCLKVARECGDALCDGRDGVRTPSWRIPEGYSGLSGHEYVGYAHGTAGIADALIELAAATHHERYAEVARSCVISLVDQAMPTLDDDSGLAWPAVPGGAAHAPFWCHGAAGVGRLLLSAVRHDLWPNAAEPLTRACRAVAKTRWSGPTLCHGLAGNAEFLLDAGRALHDDHILADASDLLALIEDFAVDDADGRSWITDAPRQISPDYMVGYAGLPVLLLRFAVPGRSVQLSRRGFQWLR
jgi:lantibiotic modifying enzyme